MKIHEKLCIVLIGILVLFVLLGAAPARAAVSDDAKEVTMKADDAKEVTLGLYIKIEENLSPFNISSTSGYRLTKSDDRFDIYLSEEIGSMYQYKDLVNGLKALDKDNVVVIHMANFGGYVHSGVQIINAMKASEALIIVELEGPSYSMGALITCAADKIQMHPYAYLMFHHYSGSFSGKGAESRKLMDALDELSRNLMTNECVSKGILTPQQVEDVMKGVDVYVHPHKILGR